MPSSLPLVDRVLDGFVARAVDALIGVIVAALVLMVLSGVMARYLLNYSLAWSDELAGVLFAWMTLMGSVAALRRKTHMTVTYFLKFFHGGKRLLAGFYILSAVSLFLLFMIAEGYELTRLTFDDYSPVLRLPVGLTYLSLPVAGSLMLAYVAREYLRLWNYPAGWSPGGG